MLKPQTCEDIPNMIYLTARLYWENAGCLYDFCIQHEDGISVVFGSTNRVVWDIYNGFRMSETHCTKQFIEANRRPFSTYAKNPKEGE